MFNSILRNPCNNCDECLEKEYCSKYIISGTIKEIHSIIKDKNIDRHTTFAFIHDTHKGEN